ncbi:hypothetical protein A3D80_03020 [Candidatus Roizmanbacteria bacterium RIFCSPHIGHO2_02_FULL_40_13b]|uniref:Uncharacterized protein n=1 Tax=Candidatus Roizmanbacteria bacterium RIFCSPHIGHO2_01_FULL_39_24 TaxID=1802032 RepID=A0A1F7GJR1_9BACT|nr:MAG: hypothetical protein A2799_02020 [Candidatus Roizmanbacteria bacterium RIFCSPHIGHO2_01_FULL_39_24]OGK27164.1 MAG: hypothetical protein A3D80_03020 [Candidatus Roizmanbacteria bacterium RIFCSPHIGHO2_02_FULL_40_13b]OGK49452.1 MAG: hypothetical protein A3A56_00155 [Candidatus Roizmanbacteria bacterium RIFCSPLOWO2_01_FULL_40_32]OGK57365.1 MAG: hypothetical protein A3H83_00820 [Candidatus Roizmanbacteria bacterium RIFCSPLOWO2_02_FULL_39_8]
MRKYHTILAYYSLIISTGLIIWSCIFTSKPIGFLLALFILPISIYFWILVLGKIPHSEINSPEHVSNKSTFAGILSIALLISTASIIFYISILSIQPKKNSPADLSFELSKIQSDVASLKGNTALIEKIVTKLDIIESNLNKIELETSYTPSTPEATINPEIKKLLNTGQ